MHLRINGHDLACSFIITTMPASLATTTLLSALLSRTSVPATANMSSLQSRSGVSAWQSQLVSRIPRSGSRCVRGHVSRLCQTEPYPHQRLSVHAGREAVLLWMLCKECPATSGHPHAVYNRHLLSPPTLAVGTPLPHTSLIIFSLFLELQNLFSRLGACRHD